MLLNWWRQWKDCGALPYGGNDLMAQPNHVVQAIMICQEEYGRVEADRHRRDEAELDRIDKKARKGAKRWVER